MTEPRAMTGRVTLGNGEVRVLASPGKRLVARIIDIAILLVAFLILISVGVAGLLLGDGDDTAGLAVMAGFGGLFIWFVIALIYEPTMIARRGQTWGKMAMRITVARADDGEVPGWGKSMGRWILPNLLNLIPVIGGLLGLLVYVSLLWDDRRQGWHDKMATTVVINA